MKHPFRRFLFLAAGAAAVTAAAVSLFAASDAWSQLTRTVKIIVPFPPGGGGDVVARIVAQQIGDMKGPTMVVEDQPGAGTVIATQNVVRSTPDGATLLFNNNSVVVVPQLRKLDYDPLSDLAPICDVASTPAVLVVNSVSPYRTLDDFLAAARARPDDITVGGATGTVLDVGFEMLQRAANVRMTYVNYQGTNQAVNAVLGEHIVAALVDYPATAGQLQAGTLRALAIGSSRRIDWLPDVPTVAESGLKDYELDIWYGAFAPAKTPPEIVSQLADWFAKAVQAPQTKARLVTQGVNAVGQCGAPFAAYLRKQFDVYGRVIREANLKIE